MKTKIYLRSIIKALALPFILLMGYNNAYAQNTFPATGSAGIGTTSPNASSLLEMVSTSKGLLIPRMTTAQRNAIVSPATGLLIYQTNGGSPGFYYYDGSDWTVVSKKGWNLTGNSGTDPLTNFVGTKDAQPLVFKVNNQRAGYIDYAGNNNTSFGYQASLSSTSGADNTAVGYNSLKANISGLRNTAVGSYALGENTAWNNTAIGSYALRYNTSGTGNVAVGTGSLTSNTVGNNNTAIGLNSLNANLSGESNTALGYFALGNNSTGSSNTAIGFNAQVGDPDLNLNNATAIGANATVNISNAVVLGNSANVGIGTTTPSNKLVVTDNTNGGPTAYIKNLRNNVSYNDGVYIQAGYNGVSIANSYYAAFLKPDGNSIGAISQITASSVAYSTTSDKRLKTNIQETKLGLMAVNKIEVKDYNFIGSKEKQTGFLAQQLYEVFPEAVTKGGDDPKTRPWMVDYGRVTPLLVKAVQELSKMNDDKEEVITMQQKEITDLKERMSAIETMLKQPKANNFSDNKITSLSQNIPNPFSSTTTIEYTLPQKFTTAQIVICDQQGRKLQSINVSGSGKNQINIQALSLAAGTYNYTLVINGKSVSTKQMVIIK